MTHTVLHIFGIAASVLLSMAVLAFGHYAPWKKWIGHELTRPQCYVYGVLAMVVPLITLWVVWANFPPPGNPFVWAIGSLITSIILSGLTVFSLYLADTSKDNETRAVVAEQAAEIWRDEYSTQDHRTKAP